MLNVNPGSYYTMEDLTEGLGWTSDSIYKFCREDGLVYSKPGKLRCFKGSDVIDFLDRHRKEGAA